VAEWLKAVDCKSIP